MVCYTGSIVVPFARKRVFELMGDWTNLCKWDTLITSSVAASPETVPGVGAKYDATFDLRGRPLPVDYICTKYDPPTYAEFEATASMFKSRDWVRCEDTEQADHTKVTASFDLSFRGILAPFSFLMDKAMQKTGPLVIKDIGTFLHDNLAEPGSNTDQESSTKQADTETPES